jgi:hypothetical protein
MPRQASYQNAIRPQPQRRSKRIQAGGEARGHSCGRIGAAVVGFILLVTDAIIRKQVPPLVKNLLAVMREAQPSASYF